MQTIALYLNRVNTISIEITLAPVIEHNVYICYIYQDSDQTTTQQKHIRFIVRIMQRKTMRKFCPHSPECSQQKYLLINSN